MLAHLGDPLAIVDAKPGDGPAVDGVRSALLRVARERHGDDIADRLSFNVRSAWGVLKAATDPHACGIERDEGLAWLWIAASQGNPQAINDLIATRQIEMLRAAPERAKKLAESIEAWKLFQAINVGPEPVDDTMTVDFIDDMRDPDGVAALAAVEAAGMVVVREIGDPTSAAGAEIMRRFGSAVNRPLPWRGRLPAPGVIEAGVLARWPWAVSAARMLEGRFAVLRSGGADHVKLRPLLFYGPPGSGKTSIAIWLGEILGLHTSVMPCGGIADTGGFAPVTRDWKSPRPSAPALQMAMHRTCNPLFVMDELDKTTRVGSQNGSLMAVLLAMVGSDRYFDTYLQSAVDLSGVSFIATANDPRLIDRALLDRFTLVHVDNPALEHFDMLLSTCRTAFVAENGIDDRRVPYLHAAELQILSDALSRNRSIRSFRQAYELLMQTLMMEREQEKAPSLLN